MPEKRKDMALVVLTCIFLYGFLLWAVLKPVDAQSASERRPLAAPPAASAYNTPHKKGTWQDGGCSRLTR